MKRTIRITVETRRVLVISRGCSTSGWCATCKDEVSLLTPEDASAIAGVRMRLVYQWVEKGLVHFSEARDGALVICANSLPEGFGGETDERMPQLETALKTATRN
jgi:hypothetical protein